VQTALLGWLSLSVHRELFLAMGFGGRHKAGDNHFHKTTLIKSNSTVFLYCRSGQALEQAAQGGGGVPIPGGV